MYRLTLLGAAGVAASLMAAPAFAATAATSANPPPATATATAAPGTPAGSEMYATVGQGGYTADQDYITKGANGNKHVNNANDANMRPSQRNADLADNGSARVSKVIGTTVYNTDNQKLGSIDDVLIGKSGTFAVISTNEKKVGVPFDKLEFGDSRDQGDSKAVLPNETQARLNTEPEIHYNEANYQAWRADHKNTDNNVRGVAGNTVTGMRPAVPMVNNHNNNSHG